MHSSRAAWHSGMGLPLMPWSLLCAFLFYCICESPLEKFKFCPLFSFIQLLLGYFSLSPPSSVYFIFQKSVIYTYSTSLTRAQVPLHYTCVFLIHRQFP